MFSLPAKKDGFRLLFPKEFLLDEITEKYGKKLQEARSFFVNPIDFLNETIQSVDILGFQNAVVQQQQSSRGTPIRDQSRVKENKFLFPSAEYTWRSALSPIALGDMTLNVNFRHTLGYLNYFMLFENFWLQYARDTKYNELIEHLYIDLFNEHGVIYSRIEVIYPVVSAMDMLSFNYSQPIATNESFKVEFKYSNLDYHFVQNSDEAAQELESQH